MKMDNYAESLDEILIDAIRMEGSEFYNRHIYETARKNNDRNLIKDQFVSLYELDKMSLLEKHDLYNRLLDKHRNVILRDNIKSVKFWIVFWSIIYIISIAITCIVIFTKLI